MRLHFLICIFLCILCPVLHPVQAFSKEKIIPEVSIEPAPAVNIATSAEVDLKGRVADYVRAFKELKESYRNEKVYAVVKGRSFDDIIEVRAMPNQTLIILTLKRKHYTTKQVVKVEDIEEFGIRESMKSNIKIYQGK